MRGVVQEAQPKNGARAFRKDESLDQLAKLINVAQFVSFSPRPRIRQEYSRVLGYAANHVFPDLREAIEVLLRRSPEMSLNVRSFTPEDPRSNEFVYGLKSAHEIEAATRRLTQAGLYVIVNETVDVRDGGVSGVVQGGVVEFAPDDTPRCVEKPGVASLPMEWGAGILSKVYGLTFDFSIARDCRLEFTVHPKPRGWKRTHLLGWELESIGALQIGPALQWPNHFSRMIGDKAFGLLIAAEIALPVPRTTVISRRIAPFRFGDETGSAEHWIRTCPREQAPGKFTSRHGWLDPFQLMAREDPDDTQIASILAQSAVEAAYSGALIVGSNGEPIIEGRKGEGQEFMKGRALPERLPSAIYEDITNLYHRAHAKLGPIRLEWVHDGIRPWVLQLHLGRTATADRVIVPGDAPCWHDFEVSRGLEALRTLLGKLAPGEGVVLLGQIGLTSHIADILRRAGRPARVH